MLKVQEGSLLGSLCVNFPAKINLRNPQAHIQQVKYGLRKLIDHDLFKNRIFKGQNIGGLDSNDMRKCGLSPQISHSWKLVSSTVAPKILLYSTFPKRKG
jgi:hypothetical protein